MRHYTEEEIAWHAVEPDAEIAAHLEGCDLCARRATFVRRIDGALAGRAAWQYPVDYRGAIDANRRSLEASEARLSAEMADARQQLEPLIGDSLAFAWEDVARKPRFLTAGASRMLSEAARENLERDALHARNLAEAALTIARGLGERHYLGKKVHQLIGRALKEKGDAHRYLGEWAEGLAALDEARREYDLAGVTPWEYGVLLYVRGVIFFESGLLPEAEQAARDSARLFAMGGDRVRGLYARLLSASVQWSRQDYRRARDGYQSVLDDIDPDTDELLAARVRGNIANCDLDMGNTPAAAHVLTDVLHTYARFGLITEVARFRWSLARIPLMEGRVEDAIPLLRASKAELEQLHQTNDAALATLDLCEALLETKRGATEVRTLCSRLIATFRTAGMLREALTALGYLRESSRAGLLTPAKVRHVRRFLERLGVQPALVFATPSD